MMKIVAFLDDTNEVELEATTEWARTLGEFLHWAVEGDYAYIEHLIDDEILNNLILRLKDIELVDTALRLSEQEFCGAGLIISRYNTVHESAFKAFSKDKHTTLLKDFEEPSKQYATHRDQREKSHAGT